MRVWSYVMTYDGGSAPNFDSPAVTLVVCKPRIRKNAKVGDLVLAFNGRLLARNPHSLRWAGIVSEVLLMEQYWEDTRFIGKRPDISTTPDNFYRLGDDVWSQVPNTTHDEGDIERDLSGKNALVFSQAWYFGDTAPELPEIFGLRVIANRRNEPLSGIGADEWNELRSWLDAQETGLPLPLRHGRTSCRDGKYRRATMD